MEPNAIATNIPVRCAIYTRKSNQEGLDQDFNSLDAQRESAEAYILSQRHEHWIALPQRYDDGGFTGANIERPGLRALIADVDAGLVDCAVVYKVDRLSRSLLDFARIMEVFDKRGVSFVSVTQQFNTTSSMGRLTLHILLSFAQFEREIISERTRDKMVAARRKGKWTGGFPALGYDPNPLTRKLTVNEEEAEQVRAIFAMFLANESLADTLAEIERRGWKTKGWTTGKGKQRVGSRFDRRALVHILSNVLYVGEVGHRGTAYPGEQPAIVDREIWSQANELLKMRKRGLGRERKRHSPLLEGRIVCAICGSPMLHGYTTKARRRYRYYLCRTARRHGVKACPGQIVSAGRIEDAVMCKLFGFANQHRAEMPTASLLTGSSGWSSMTTRDRHNLLDEVIEQIRYDHRVEGASIRLRQGLESGDEEQFITVRKDPSGKRYSASASLASELILPQITRRMALAIRFETMLKEETACNYRELARRAGVSTARIGQILKLRRLAPRIQERLLFLTSNEKYVPEPVLWRIAEEIDWKQQVTMFDQVVDASCAPVDGPTRS